MKRPPKAVVEAAIKAGLGGERGSMAKVAAILTCCRPSLYRWCYQYGLDKLAGISSNPSNSSYRHVKASGGTVAQGLRPVASGDPEGRTLRLVDTVPSAQESKVPATAQVAESVWKRTKKLAIDLDCPPSQIVEEALVAFLELNQSGRKSKEKA